MFNQNTGLPYRTDVLQNPLLPNIGPNNPPYVPNIQHLPEITQVLPAIAGMVAQEIQSKVANPNTTNSLRIFMFNQYSQNNFMNDEFNSLVAGVCDYLVLALAKRQFQNLEQAAINIVPMLVTVMAGVNARTFPALQQLIPSEIARDVQGSISAYDNIVNEINAFKSRGQGLNTGWAGGQGTGWGAGPGMQQQTWQTFGGGQGWGQGGGGGWGGQRGGFGSGQGGGWGNLPARSSIFNQDPAGRQPGAVGRSNVGDRWGSDSTTTTTTTPAPAPMREINFAGTPPPLADTGGQGVVKQPYKSTQELSASASAQEQPTPVKLSAWRPSAQQPYLPVYNPEEYELVFQKDANGIVTYNLKQRNNTVDQSRHSTHSTLGLAHADIPNLMRPGDVLPKISAGVKQLNNELENKAPAPEGQEKPDVTTHVFEGPLYSISQRAAIFQGSLERLAMNEGEAPMVFRTYALVAEPVVTAKDENPRIVEYGQAKTFYALKKMLSDDAAAMAPALWSLCNRKITDAVNRFMRLSLSLVHTSIDSYVTDIEELVPHLGKKYGEAVQTAFLKNQENLIRATFEMMDADEMAGWNSQYIDAEAFTEDNKPFIAYPSGFVSLTYLNCRLPELGIEMAPNVGSLVDPKLTPVIHEVLASLFDDVRKERQEAFERHFIVLNDGHVLETTEGALVPDSYLLSLVK